MGKTYKWLYRLESRTEDNGLWYDSNNNFVFGIGKLEGCATKDLPMDYDERYHEDGLNWFSSCSNCRDLWHWYSLEDAKNLMDNGFVFTKYLACDFHEYPNETCFLKETCLARVELTYSEVVALHNEANGIMLKTDATKIALQMHDNFFSEFVTAMANTAAWKKRIADVDEFHKGYAAAFDEITERVKKEWELSRQPIVNFLNGFGDDARHLFEEKNWDLETLMPDSKLRGRENYWDAIKFRGKISDLIDKYIGTGFELGRKYEKLYGKDRDGRRDEV